MCGTACEGRLSVVLVVALSVDVSRMFILIELRVFMLFADEKVLDVFKKD